MRLQYININIIYQLSNAVFPTVGSPRIDIVNLNFLILLSIFNIKLKDKIY